MSCPLRNSDIFARDFLCLLWNNDSYFWYRSYYSRENILKYAVFSRNNNIRTPLVQHNACACIYFIIQAVYKKGIQREKIKEINSALTKFTTMCMTRITAQSISNKKKLLQITYFNKYPNCQKCLNLPDQNLWPARLSVLRKAKPYYGELRILIWTVQFCKTLYISASKIMISHLCSSFLEGMLN
jgi:hypothetical protein